jgi:hypothetical protein
METFSYYKIKLLVLLRRIFTFLSILMFALVLINHGHVVTNLLNYLTEEITCLTKSNFKLSSLLRIKEEKSLISISFLLMLITIKRSYHLSFIMTNIRLSYPINTDNKDKEIKVVPCLKNNILFKLRC